MDGDRHEANPSYALGQLANALLTGGKVEAWSKVYQGMLSGALRIGSRAPVPATPTWATLEVVKGGFATGELLAGGPLRPHEEALLARVGLPFDHTARAALNAYFLSEAGQAELRGLLRSGCYRVEVPEEGALLVVAWLLERGHVDLARAVLDELGPWVSRLRFYPVPDARPLLPTTLVHVQTVGQTIAQLEKVQESADVEAQRETLAVWNPTVDRLVALLLETVEGPSPGLRVEPSRPNGVVEGGWPCQRYPEGWAARARVALDELQRLRATHTWSTKPARSGSSIAILRQALVRCLTDPRALTGREVGLVRGVMARVMHKRGLPDSERGRAVRAEQSRVAALPSRRDLARLVLIELERLPASGGLPSLDAALGPEVNGARLPSCVRRPVTRCLDAPVEWHVKEGAITSSETLARVLPQLTGQIGAVGIDDPDLRRLYGAIYCAFRGRRSLLLLNLESQVRLSELPWLLAVDAFRHVGHDQRAVARRALEEVVVLALTSFPHVLLPNKLLQELRALAQGAGLQLPIVDELAADIFMGEFTAKYVDAALRASAQLAGTLYQTYYGIDPRGLKKLRGDAPQARKGPQTSPAFAALCRERAGEPGGGGGGHGAGSVARNGKVIEQEQILTTHNLAVLVGELDLRPTLEPRLGELAQRCFTWICHSQRALARAPWKCRLRGAKNAAFAWREMVLLLALAPDGVFFTFLGKAHEHLAAQKDDLRARLLPRLQDLARAASGRTPERPFLGWTTEKHWLLA